MLSFVVRGQMVKGIRPLGTPKAGSENSMKISALNGAFVLCDSMRVGPLGGGQVRAV